MEPIYGEEKKLKELEEIATLLMSNGKGILSADEPTKSFSLMFKVSIQVNINSLWS